ncbi:type II toxin-antitoxin system Phd/YefM family antitoxin [Streptomyces formicae]|uniref:Antitoxin n=1 Tax=Streptomyces formicae TaxID=1616117 RepID=A0ABY3WY81_9ACTN|nr:type II toxin-antitoxin system prevent-host-death family antitoxin [Streptomyces formicae]UNM15747.1 type II toxin-antitoxin system prevent-host-death family antitoxin [Streptomyces formicae]
MTSEEGETRITVRDLQRNAAAVLKRLEQGERITVTRHGRTVARIIPPDPVEEALNQAFTEGILDPAALTRARTATQTSRIPREPASPEGDVGSRALQELRDAEGDR